MTLKMITHALRMIFADLGGALRVTGPLYLLAQACTILPVWLLFGEFNPNDPLGIQNLSVNPTMFIFVFIGAIASIVFSTWMAVAWHRYVLLGETGLTYPKGKVGSYFWTGFGYALIILIPAFIVIFIIGAVAGLAAVNGFAVNAAITILVTFLFLRIAMGLPGLCVDNAIVFGQSWTMTGPLSAAILGVAVVAGTASTVLLFILPALGASVTISVVISLIIGWFQWIIALSVLTTIYGVVVEGRELT